MRNQLETEFNLEENLKSRLLSTVQQGHELLFSETGALSSATEIEVQDGARRLGPLPTAQTGRGADCRATRPYLHDRCICKAI